MKSFLDRKGISLSPREYFITASSFMALCLFASLIIGLIIKSTAGQEIISDYVPRLAEGLREMVGFAMDSKIMGGARGVAIAYGLKAPPMVLFSALFAGAFGAEVGGPAG